MSCQQCRGIEAEFDNKYARRSLKRYRKKGPAKTTRLLLNAIKAQGVEGASLMDIGGGVGTIQHELLKAGVREVVNVEASPAFSETAREEAQRQGHEQAIRFYLGNFVELSKQLPPSDIVTLDRVICCFDDMEEMVCKSSHLAKKVYGVVFPQDTWWVRIGFYTLNFFLKILRREFRTFLHSTQKVDELIRKAGLTLFYYQTAGIWQVRVYSR